MSIPKIYAVLLFGAIVLITGCKAQSWKSDQFEGIWRVETSDHVASGTASIAAALTLDHNGRFVASSLPIGFLQLDDVKPNQALSGSGTWSLTGNDRGREERLRLTFINVEGSTGRNLPYGAELFIQGSSSKPHLFYFKGDPDENQRVVFRRDSPRQ